MSSWFLVPFACFGLLSGDFVQAVAIGPTDGMWRQQENNRGVGLVRREMLQSLLDERFPVVAGLETLFVEPDSVVAAAQIVTQMYDQRCVFVVAVTEEDALRNEGLFRRERVPAVLADMNAALLTEDEVLGRAVGAVDFSGHGESFLAPGDFQMWRLG